VPTVPTKTIVLLDDEKSYTDLMCRLLAEGFDCPVHAFYRPLEALSALPVLNPGVVVTDYFMPQMDGIEFIRRASALCPGSVFLIITGHNLSAQKDQLERLVALKGVLAKPFGWRTLAAEILKVWPTDVPVPLPPGDTPAL
jgi:CheY-like chemotaxis protein